MTSILMAGCYDFFIIRWIAQILGVIMSALYSLFSFVGIYNIGLCIVAFTIIVKMLMFPMTLKQQKFTKVSSVMQPELQAIQKKYQNKKDNDSMIRMQQETKAVYAKYGTSPTGSCLPLLIQMPILLALYAVIISIPTYVPAVSNLYENIGTEIVSVMDDFNEINTVNTIVTNKKNEELSTIIKNNYKEEYYTSEALDIKDTVIYDNLSDMYATVKPLNDFNDGYDIASTLIKDLKNTSDADWKKAIEEENKKEKPSQYKVDLLTKYSEFTDTQWNSLEDEFAVAKANIEKEEEEISSIYSFAFIDLSKSPSEGEWYALIIPLLAFLTQFLSVKISQSTQPSMEGNPMASSMKMMTLIMPLISAFFCYSLPAGLGLYWVMNAVVQILQQLFINDHFKSMDVNEIIAENVAKKAKKAEKRGITTTATDKHLSSAATMNAKNIKVDSKYKNDAVEVSESNNAEESGNTSSKKMGSIASRANMVQSFNEKNNNK